MTPAEREKLNELCKQIQTEKDHEKFTALLEELNKLLAEKERRFLEDARKDPLL